MSPTCLEFRANAFVAGRGSPLGLPMTRDEHGAQPGPTVLSEEERAYVDAHRVARLATADAHRAPHVVPVVYTLVGNSIYFVVDEKPKRTRAGLKRLRNIAENPRVALLIDDYDEEWSRLAFLLVHGTAHLVDDPEEYSAALAALRRRYPQYRWMRIDRPTHPMVRIQLERRHFWRAESAHAPESG